VSRSTGCESFAAVEPGSDSSPKSAILTEQVSPAAHLAGTARRRISAVTEAARALNATPRATTPIAEEIRLRLADAWGEMGAAWGVAPAIARVHAYLMTRQQPLTEREVREALNLSHRAASLALAEAEAWGLVERVSEPRRVGKRGPAGTAYMAIGDHWRWFGRVVAERKVREGDPIIVVLEKTLIEANGALASHPGDQDLIRLRDWLSTFLVFVRLFDRAVGLVSRLEPTELERAIRLLGDVPDDTIMRLVKLLDGLPDEDVLGLVEALSRLSPSSARRATTLMSGVVRTLVR
jgi:DNA-binding transcriptional regulator GbsR (MarR family)